MHYTVTVKHASAISFICAIFTAVGVSVLLHAQQREAQIVHLLDSPSVKDKLAGITLAAHLSFDELTILLGEVIQGHSPASTKAQEVLAASAFSEHRTEELSHLQINRDLLDSVVWWSTASNPPLAPKLVLDDSLASPFINLSFLAGFSDIPPTDDLLETPLRDRDGSVLLAVLAIEKCVPKKELQGLVQSWSSDFDFERQKAAVFFASMLNTPFPFAKSSNSELATIQVILAENNYALAWRAIHKSDGTINPDIALAGMLANPDKFFPILIESATNKKWTHPEHPIMIAFRFAPEIANKIPTELLQNSETRNKWWSLFTCGLLLERR